VLKAVDFIIAHRRRRININLRTPNVAGTCRATIYGTIAATDLAPERLKSTPRRPMHAPARAGMMPVPRSHPGSRHQRDTVGNSRACLERNRIKARKLGLIMRGRKT